MASRWLLFSFWRVNLYILTRMNQSYESFLCVSCSLPVHTSGTVVLHICLTTNKLLLTALKESIYRQVYSSTLQFNFYLRNSWLIWPRFLKPVRIRHAIVSLQVSLVKSLVLAAWKCSVSQVKRAFSAASDVLPPPSHIKWWQSCWLVSIRLCQMRTQMIIV